MTNKAKCGKIAQIIPNRLYFACFETPPLSTNQIVYLNIDESVHYDAFYDDFGPMNLAVLYRFCEALHAIVKSKEKRKIFVFTNDDSRNCVNGAYLVASYMIIYHNLTADQAYVRIQAVEPPPFVGFRDASMGPPSYLLHVQNVIKSVEKALQFGWLNFKTFDPDEYEHYERVENGDLNWIVPNKILSFCGPHDRSYIENEYCYHAPEVYFDYFRDNNVSTIIRLNRKVYDAKRFVEGGFEHIDLFFIDGSTPSDEIVLKFISVVEKAPGAVAIHCKAGLGRTGTLIACWMMKHFKLTAHQCMAWLRICRPGSVIGPQQQFLIEKQQWCWRLGQKIMEDKTTINEVETKRVELTNNDGEYAKSIRSEKPIEAHNIKCKITNNNGAVLPKSKTLPADLIEKMEEKKVRKSGENNDSVMTTSKLNNSYALRSKNTSINEMTPGANGNLYDETAVNEFGQSQGDRLCQMKAKAQHSHPKTSLDNPLMERLSKKEGSPRMDNNIVPVLPTTPKRTTEERIPAQTQSQIPIKPSARFSSATTPIKQLRLSSQTRRVESSINASVFNVSRPSVSAGYHNMNVVGRIPPISKVTVSSNCRPLILKNNTNKKFLPMRNSKPYSPANRVALDYARFNAGMASSHKNNDKFDYMTHGLSKRNSTSSIYSMNNAGETLKKYELRPRGASQFQTPGASAPILRGTALATSKSAGRLV